MFRMDPGDVGLFSLRPKRMCFFESCIGDMHVLWGVFTYMNGWLWLNIVGNICNRPSKILWQWVVQQKSPDAQFDVSVSFHDTMEKWRKNTTISNHWCFRKRWVVSHVEFVWLTPYIGRMPLWRKHRFSYLQPLTPQPWKRLLELSCHGCQGLLMIHLLLRRHSGYEL